MSRARIVLSTIAVLLGAVVTAGPAAAAVFTSSAAITVADGKVCLNCTDPGVASSYPSTITVSGLSGTVSNVTVTLNSASHPYPADFDIVLVGPGGQRLVVASDAGTTPTTNATVTLSDAAATALPATGAWTTGSFKPTDHSVGPADVWPAPAPAGPYADPAPTGTATFASVFGGTAPNGQWNLYVVDDSLGDTGSFSGGWSIDVTTASLASTTTTLASSSTPSTTGQSVTFTATVTEGAGPATSGTVTFSDGATALAANVPVNASGQATLSTSTLSEGAHTITAAYSGDGTRAPSSGTVQQVVDNATTRSGDDFCNTGSVTVNDQARGYPYPSRIFTTGLTGTVDTLTLTLNGVTHPFADDLDVLLVGPSGQKLVAVSDAGGGTALSNVTTTFRDSAATAIGTTGGWGSSSRPVDHGAGDAFPSPAPSSPAEPAPAGAATFASVFAGGAPNGTWSLYVVDDSLGGAGSVAGGWCLGVTTQVPVDATADAYATEKNTVLNVPAPGVLGNDTPQPLTATPVAGAATTQGGTVSVDADGRVSYTPPTGFTGNDTFTYTATNGVSSDAATVTVNVSNAPSVVGSTVTRRQGSAATTGAIATVSDVETAAGNLTVALGAVPAGLTVTNVVNNGGAVTADVAASCAAPPGLTSVPLTVTDGDGYDTDGTFVVEVLANTPPVLSYAPANLSPGSAGSVSPSSGPSDNGGAPGLSVLNAGTTYPGVVSVAPDGTVSLPGAGSGDYVVTVRAVDGCGDRTDAVLPVRVSSANTAPDADAGGPYTMAEGGSLSLDGSGSDDPDGGALTYTWDVDGDGSFGDATGATPTLSWSALEALGVDDGPGSVDVSLRVSDGGAADTDQAGLTVTNTAPTANGPAAADAVAGTAVVLGLTAQDPSSADTAAGLTWTVDWGDGSEGASLSHAYAAPGTYPVSATAKDKDGGVSAPVDVLITVSGAGPVPNDCGSGEVLLVAGTSGDDTITIRPTAGGLSVQIGDAPAQTYPNASRVDVVGLAGDDTVTMNKQVTARAHVYGGAGDDVLKGSDRADALVGGDGHDRLVGRGGRDVLIGGTGADDARGGKGSDLLVAGSTDHDDLTSTAKSDLCDLAREWRSDESYSRRVATLAAGVLLVPGVSVLTDTDVDELTGGAGVDWFLLDRRGAGARDTSDRVAGEIATDI